MNLLSPTKLLFWDGLFLMLIGFGQAINSIIGYQFGIGGYKILHVNRFAALGFFEMNFLLGLFGLLILSTSKTAKYHLSLLGISSIIHAFISFSNIFFWSDVFIINNATLTGSISIIVHLCISMLSSFLIVKYYLSKRV